MLGHEVFFTSPRLAALATQAEILSNRTRQLQQQGSSGSSGQQQQTLTQSLQQHAKQQQQQQQQQAGAGLARAHSGGATASLLEEYQCPICLETLHNPVVLTCVHRWAWV